MGGGPGDARNGVEVKVGGVEPRKKYQNRKGAHMSAIERIVIKRPAVKLVGRAAPECYIGVDGEL